MKKILNIIVILISLATTAYASPRYVKGGECAVAAAEAARNFAAANWNTPAASIKIQTAEIMRSSNPAPIEVYAVGLLSPSRVPVLFNVSLENIGGNCNIIDVSLSEFLE